jgi:L-ascorbate metabolism protein UlaG (beta-lactamase superfamily)
VTVRYDPLSVRWFGYATARIDDGETTVYTDPGRYGVLTGEWSAPDGVDTRHPAGPAYDARDGDVVLVTHDPDGIRRVAAQDATVVIYEGVDAQRAGRPPSPESLAESEDYDLIRIGECETVEAAGVPVRRPRTTTPTAHTRTRTARSHTPGVRRRLPVRRRRCVGPVARRFGRLTPASRPRRFVASRQYFGSVCVDRHEAADLAERLDPDVVCPIHCDTRGFLAADSGAFAADVAGRGVLVGLDGGWA